ncbi:uncharacterized protein E6C27_scaffold191G00420 [Cucumis melo var. makuwa]|uniref:Ty3-gypsy retrotransposon protein n=1 Tax=Cucumis melo var. makuwa TaxID=1194695 RepID=A0A5A7SZM5_CUCMM|nr:uncharacterized protein E6C27_scaffold191G00420 [Cucumis melo var. makuwa]
MHEEDKDFPRTQRLVTLADFFPTRFLSDHQDENPEVVACHAINATDEESIPLRSLEVEGVSKDLSRFNVDDLLSLPQETKTILINALLNSVASSSSAPTATYERNPYCMSIDFLDEDLLLGSNFIIDPCILMEELSNSKLIIQGFNQGSQRVIGMIRLELIIGDQKANALFRVIDSRSTYKLLLGCPWIHGNKVVTSTLHQCFKFYQDGVNKVEGNSNPFSEAESHFTDAKFYLKNDSSPEAVSVEVPLVNREDNLQLKSLASKEPHKSIGTFHSGKSEASISTTKSVILMDEKTSNPPILHYVSLSRRKKGESPFVESPQGLKVDDIDVLKESFTTPLTKITKQEIKIDLTEASLPQRRMKDGFDPKAYKLMVKTGYDFTTHTEFKSLKIHEQPKLSSTQKKLLRKGHAIPMSRKGLGYKSPEPIRITRKGKEKVVDSNHITVKEVDSMEEKEGLHVQTDSSIDTKKKESTSRVSVWRRIKHINVESHHGKEFPCEVKGEREIRSNIPSRMKRKTFVTLNTSQGSLKVKRHEVILTNPEKEDSEQGEGEISCHHITILEELEIETPEEDAEDAPTESRGWWPIYRKRAEREYKDIFAWSYKEMPGLDPKVAVHHLAIKPGYRPIKQAQRPFLPELIPQIEVEVNKLIEAGFIREVKYPTWIANIVPVRKKKRATSCLTFMT